MRQFFSFFCLAKRGE